MKIWMRLFAVLLCVTLLSGCSGNISEDGSFVGNTSPTTEETGESTLYQRLFDSDYKIEIALHMADTELAKLQQDHERYSAAGSKSPIYRMADMDVTITAPDGTQECYTIEQVGVRMKGNTSRTDFYSDDEGIYNQIHLKISFQETFDDETYYGADALVWQDSESRQMRKDRTFASLEKLDLRWNKCNDGTYIREYYAFEMFRANGVVAPYMNLASVELADLHMGVFTVCEPVDKVFLKHHLPEELQGGDLYKCGWTSHGADLTSDSSIGIEDEDQNLFYIYDLKTNKKTSDHSRLTELITALNTGAMTKARFEELVDVDRFLSFAAVTYLLGNPDDGRNNDNNFYIYFPPEGGCILIPTDYDRCLGVTHEWDPTGDAVTEVDPFGIWTATGQRQKNPLYLYSVCSGGYYVAEFAEKLEELAQSKWVSNAYFESVFLQMRAHYGDLTTPDRNFHNQSDHQLAMTLDGSDGNWTFDAYMSAKLAALQKALENVNLTVAPNLPEFMYIRGEFTDWAVLPEYAMSRLDDGNYGFSLSGGCFKVYDQRTDSWYGSEAIGDSEVEWSTDGSTNIILPTRNYVISFDPVSKKITIKIA